MPEKVTPIRPAAQRQSREVAERKRNRVYAKRVPSVLPMERRAEIVSSVRAGRSIHQVAQEHSVAEVVVVELWVRDLARRREIAA